MALINHRAREVHFKLVYYGPGLSGTTTNLQFIHDRLPADRRGRLISIATDHERTLFFDFLPVDLGDVNGFTTRFHLYTVPGQVYYKLSRRAVLTGADGLVFVADSHPARERANRDALDDLEGQLESLGLSAAHAARIPRVFQYNKRDLRAALPIERLRAMLNPGGAPEIEAVASEGRGVGETLKAGCKAVLARISGAGQSAAAGQAAAGQGSITGQAAAAGQAASAGQVPSASQASSA
jgi:signal recognition particle receptor subunit beta